MSVADARDVYNSLKIDPHASQLAAAYALRCLVHTATFPENYAADARWNDAIVPSEAGIALLGQLSTLPIPRADLRLALFGLFWFQEPLIDVSRTNLELVRRIIEEEARSRHIFWPMSQGRSLYDRYGVLFHELRDSLTPLENHALLEGTSQGIYQAGNIITGPLGIIDAQSTRHYPPAMTLGLWHCPMLDCGRIHPVDLTPPSISLTEGYRLLERAAVLTWNTESRWEQVLLAWPHPAHEAWRARSEMPVFLGECSVAEDRACLLTHALSGSHGTTLRSTLESKRARAGVGSPAAVVGRLSEDERLQVLLTMPDVDLKRMIDELVWKREIDIPSGEVREVAISKSGLYSGRFSARLELSSLGMRVRRNAPVLLFRDLLTKAYAQNGESADLDWRLRKAAGVSTAEALMTHLRTAKPPAAIEMLVLTSPRITRDIAQALDTTIDMPDAHARAVLEWKLGFDSPREDRRLTVIRRAIGTFSDVLSRVGALRNDSDREMIRSAGVNAFVELEGFIDDLIAYVVWLLCSDHPKTTRFVYTRSMAAASVPLGLGAELRSGTESVRWTSSGNTLGTCVRYLQRLGEWLTTLPHADRSGMLRADNDFHDLPSDSVTMFPFRHTQLWADAAPDELRELGKMVNACIEHLNEAQVAAVRNGLEHYREPHRFPTVDRVSSTVESIKMFIEAADRSRLIPKLFWIAGTSSDSFGQVTVDLIDYRGDTLCVHAPRTVHGLLHIMDLPKSRPILIGPGNLFGVPNAELIFVVRQDSVYSRYWDSYPRRQESVSSLESDSGEGVTLIAEQDREKSG